MKREHRGSAAIRHSRRGEGTALGCPRDFLGNRFVYAGVSSRTRGLCIGINVNPSKNCNFNCVYCEVRRDLPPHESRLDVEVMAVELERTLGGFLHGQLRRRPLFRGLPDQMIESASVLLSGDGEPTLAPEFLKAVQTVVHMRALGKFPFFKIVLLTNAKEIGTPEVQQGIKALTRSDEIWVKFDAGTQNCLNRITRTDTPIETICQNTLALARERPIVIQSMFPALAGREPSIEEIEQYAQRLGELRMAGAQIEMVQVCSATPLSRTCDCSHLPLKLLSKIARTVTARTGLKAEVF